MKWFFMFAAYFPATVFGAAFNVCWQPPVENVDGTPVIGIAHYSIHYGVSSGAYEDVVIVTSEVAGANDNCHSVVTSPGLYFVAMTVTDLEGDESSLSNEVAKETDGITPLPAIILVEEKTAFTVIKQANRFVLLPVGTVPAETSCDRNNSVNGHGAVPTSAVVWTSPTGSRPIVVVAKCDG